MPPRARNWAAARVLWDCQSFGNWLRLTGRTKYTQNAKMLWLIPFAPRRIASLSLAGYSFWELVLEARTMDQKAATLRFGFAECLFSITRRWLENDGARQQSKVQKIIANLLHNSFSL